MHLNEFARCMRTVGDENRLRILCHLMKKRRLCVSDIAHDLALSVATTSHHLRVMAKDDLVVPIRDGKHICYELPKTAIMTGFRKFLCAHAQI